ncbi:hypothetical protein KP509_30G070000 [Ceratopteris richardii]|uniref:Shugoshin C-terminal domain-containing protein n=1 Tax=Ceratopteris richardii TaxID=49495 RepID=A0A8T2R3N6_CERRI|nr:hypothetical protein KP509_30G070000 [Ceratopteris richardii]
MPSKVGLDITGRNTPQRARLSDITNTAPASLSKRREDDHPAKTSDAHVQKEMASLRKALVEKDKVIQAQKVKMEKLWSKYMSKTKQNEDVIRQNGCLFKELIEARDSLKVLQHENAQMVAVHKAVKSELQAKLARALEKVDLRNKPGLTDDNEALCNAQANPVLAKLAESRARRAISCLHELPVEAMESIDGGSKDLSAPCRTMLRRRTSLNYKEPSLKSKLRQAESVASQIKACLNPGSGMVHLSKVSEESSVPVVMTLDSV